MRSIRMLAVAALVAAVWTTPAATAEPHPNSCDTPTPVVATSDTGADAGLCTEIGYGGVGIDTADGAYVLADGAADNEDPSGMSLADGYVVVVVGPSGANVGCTGDGDWNRGDAPDPCP